MSTTVCKTMLYPQRKCPITALPWCFSNLSTALYGLHLQPHGRSWTFSLVAFCMSQSSVMSLLFLSHVEPSVDVIAKPMWVSDPINSAPQHMVWRAVVTRARTWPCCSTTLLSLSTPNTHTHAYTHTQVSSLLSALQFHLGVSFLSFLVFASCSLLLPSSSVTSPLFMFIFSSCFVLSLSVFVSSSLFHSSLWLIFTSSGLQLLYLFCTPSLATLCLYLSLTLVLMPFTSFYLLCLML